jgi:hypothetical protein
LRGQLASGLIALLLLLIIATPVSAAEQEISYDSGTPGGSVSLPYSPSRWRAGQEEVNEKFSWLGNSMLAVRFTPDNSTGIQMLLGVRFYILGDLANISVFLFDHYGDFMVYPIISGPPGGSQLLSRVYRWRMAPTSTGWVDVNVTDAMNPVFVSDDFYVAAEFNVAQKPSLGVDTSGPRSDRSWFVDNQTANGWVKYSDYAKQHGAPDGNLMIRALTIPVAEVGAAAKAAKNAPPDWIIPIVGLTVVLIVAAVAVLVLRKRGRL